jgi:hypothetical protein
MERSGRRILLAVEPAVLEGALARMLAAEPRDRVVQMGHRRLDFPDYDAAVVSDRLPHGVRAAVVITLPDTRGNGGTGTVRSGDVVHEVEIAGAERVVELLAEYVP